MSLAGRDKIRKEKSNSILEFIFFTNGHAELISASPVKKVNSIDPESQVRSLANSSANCISAGVSTSMHLRSPTSQAYKL